MDEGEEEVATDRRLLVAEGSRSRERLSSREGVRRGRDSWS